MFGVTHIVPTFGPAVQKTEHKTGFAAGTYIGTGAATAAIVNTGFKRVHHVWMSLCPSARAAATTDGVYSGRPCIAAGTPGSFYPLVFRLPGGANAVNTLGVSAGATFKWLALVEE